MHLLKRAKSDMPDFFLLENSFHLKICLEVFELRALGCALAPRALFVACPFGHVPGSLLSADPGDGNSKRPPGRSRAGLHAPGDQQEGSDPGVFCQLPRALLSGRPSELPELAVSGHPGLGLATHRLMGLQKPRNQGRRGTRVLEK